MYIDIYVDLPGSELSIVQKAPEVPAMLQELIHRMLGKYWGEALKVVQMTDVRGHV